MLDAAICALPSLMTDTLVLRQLYEWAEHDFLKPNMPFNTILDAGANIGIASVMFATM